MHARTNRLSRRVFVIGWLLLAPAFLLGAGLGLSGGAEAGTRNEISVTRHSTTGYSTAGTSTAENGGMTTTGKSTGPATPILVELFTSQGCSSCPPADRLLRELGERAELIPLAFHVDYWNHLGWADPFSSEAWSNRQRRYARWFGEDTIYTPQLVVNGSRHLVGSERQGILQATSRARQAVSQVSDRNALELLVEHSHDRLDARVKAERPVPQDSLLYLALYERNLEIRIGRGENSGRTLEYDYVVRDLRSVGHNENVTFRLDPEWKVRDLGVVAFLQDTTTGAVQSVTRSPSSNARGR